MYYETAPSCQIPELGHLYELFLGQRRDGTFVEVGAFDGLTYSNTWGLARRGWRGVMLEPDPEVADACRRTHMDNAGITVLSEAAGATSGSLTMYRGGFLTSANSAVMEQFRRLGWGRTMITGETYRAPLRTLDEILSSENLDQGFDLLVVDVEGYEREVFAGFSLRLWRPRMIIVELHDTCPVLTATRDADFQLGRQIATHEYAVVYKDFINTVFVRHDVQHRAYGSGLAGA